ncbi:MAG TPA: bifunctional serine/threonine-protein kinase/formylglycine-generating enzyme family protein [Pyrinomonadaceae bacterium]|nr:bifunctional serine/threonine-protein kinase/formylglycine-generating enzyme family protein [Pyrinomonadaceae bacterium]
MKECPVCKRCFPDEINHCPHDGDATTPSLHGEPILDGRFQLESRLGQGGMGVVFKARHIFLKTAHAIKVILPDLVGNDPMLATRFRQEALAAAAIRHPNIIAVTDFGVVRGTMPFLVMEFVNGRSLQDILAEEKVMAPARALEFICAMGAGVAAAHRQKIVHRDLKPLNIMIQSGVPVSEGLKILDFGLAKIKSGDLLGSFVQAKTSGLMGSPFYMAPEQWSDDEPDARADIYSLGIILYQMLAGDVPFKGSSIPSIMKKHLTIPPPTFQSLGVNVPARIEAVVRHALEKEPGARVPTIERFISELREAVNATPGSATPAPRATGSLDPNQTVMSAVPTTTAAGIDVGSGTAANADVVAGTVTSAVSPLEAQPAIVGVDLREQEQKEQAAREELAREEDARRALLAETERKRKEEEDLRRREREEREARERRQREQIERVERQAKELEDRLERLATSVPPQIAVVDPEATQVRGAVQTQAGADHGFLAPGTAFPRSDVVVTPRSNRRIPLMLAALSVILLVGITSSVLLYLYLKQDDQPAVSPTPAETPTNNSTTGAVKPDLVEIPGGAFQMGRDDGPIQERPQHPVTIEPFFMDRTEVTNEEYAEFVRDMRVEPPNHWVRGRPLPLQEKWPVVNVSPQDAEAFAAWRSKRDGVRYRLPTEEEWEYAARSGGVYKLYPWGDTWQDKRAVVKEADARPVGSIPEGANQWGVVDLIGNVWEWTSSTASLYPGNRAGEISAATRDWVVARGGSYSSNPQDRQIPVSATYRDWYDREFRQPNYGFRLVRSAN